MMNRRYVAGFSQISYHSPGTVEAHVESHGLTRQIGSFNPPRILNKGDNPFGPYKFDHRLGQYRPEYAISS